MSRYLLNRVAASAVVALLVMVFLGALVHLVPGDPVTVILGPRASDELSQTVRAEMGLDDSIPVQIGDFVAGAVRGDFGTDFVSDVPVSRLVGEALPHTIVLALASLLLAVVVGVPLGVYAATRPNTWIDRVTAVVSVSFIAVPSYVGGLLLLLVFSVWLGWLPAIGAGSFSDPVDYLRHLVLPATALAIGWIGYLARLIRASMLEVLSANYIRTAQAFGLHDRRIAYKYALKNAIIPTVAVLGVGLGNLMGGAIFVEVIFARPGLGNLVFDSLSSRNFPIVRGGVLTLALLFVLANLLADLSYRFLDPRIAVEARRG
jgi:peptide/nickel transport system permease protein